MELKTRRPQKNSKAAHVRTWTLSSLARDGPQRYTDLVRACAEANPEINLDTIKLAVFEVGKKVQRTDTGEYKALAEPLEVPTKEDTNHIT